MGSVGGIMVLFYPDEELLKSALDALLPQVDRLVIVDNTPGAEHSSLLPSTDKIHYIPLGENLGIATAQNRGISFFKSCPPDYILFSDQDTVASPGLVEGLKHGYELLSERQPVIAVGPLAINRATGQPYHQYKELLKSQVSLPVPHIFRSYIMSSFSLIPFQSFEKVGLFKEKLFIDGVECEWYWRGREKFGQPAMLTALTVVQEFGKYKRVLGRNCSISSPFRLFYQIRNALWLRKLPYAPSGWRKQSIKGLIGKIGFYSIAIAPRGKYILQIIKGLSEGLRGNL